MSTAVRMLCALLLAAQALQLHAADDVRMRSVRSTPEYRFPKALRLVEQRLVFSAYSANGNDSDVIEIDPADGVPKTLVASQPEARFVAADSRYLIFSRRGSNAHQLVVLDRDTGKERGSIRLSQGAPWAHIHGERLIVVQYREAVFLRLPELKVEKTQPMDFQGHEIQPWKDRLVMLRSNDLRIHDLTLGAFIDLSLPKRSAEAARCGPRSLRIHGDLAITNVYCSEFAVHDLGKGELLRIISGQAKYEAFDVIDGTLFAAGVDASGKSEIHVYELETGRELARIEARAQFLAARAGKLLALNQETAKPARFTVYEPDLVAIRSESGREARVLVACDAKGTVDDVTRAIETCEEAGIRGYLDSRPLTPGLSAALGNYADLLARTLSRYDEAIPLLERLAPTLQREASLTRARRTAEFFKTGRSADAPALPGLRNTTIEFDGFGSVVFETDHLYAERWNCGVSGAEGVMLDVFDRRTYAKQRSVKIAPCDDDYQDALSSIISLGNLLILGLEHRYEPEQRMNLVVLDSKDFRIVAQGHVATAPLRMGEWQGRLLYCGSETGEPNTRLDTSSARLVPASKEESLACLNGEVSRTGKSFRYEETEGGPLRTTRSFRVYKAGRNSATMTLRFVPTGAGPQFDAEAPAIGSMVAARDQDALIWVHTHGLEKHFVYYDIAARRERTLFALKQNDSLTDILVWRHYLFVALQRDLIVYDLARFAIMHYEKQLLADRIQGLFLDEDRLIVRSGPSRVIDLPVLVASFGERGMFEP